MREIRSIVKNYALLVFIGIAFAIAIPAFLLQTPETPVILVLLLLMLGSYGPAAAALAVLDLIWGLFHLPLYWQRPVYAVLNFPMILGFSIILIWLFLNTGGSVPLCTLFQAVFNIWAQVFLNTTDSEIILVFATLVLWIFAGLAILRYGLGLVRKPLAFSDGYGRTI